MSTMDYLEFKNYLEHSYLEHASKAGMPTNLKQESSNIKRASERAKFMNQMQRVCNKIRVKYGQLTNLQDANFDTLNDPVRGNGRKTGGGYTGGEEINKLRWKYSKETNPLVKQLHNLLNAGKNSPLFTDAEKEKMRKWMQEGGTLGELATVYSDVFGSVSHDNLEHGWFTDLFKQKHQNEAKGSRAGMPSNIPTISNKHGNAVAKRDSYADQVKRLTANLSDYQAKEAKAKQEYEFYRKKADEVRKAIKEAERYRDAAAKEALTTPEVNTTVTSAPPKYIRLPEGSKAGMPSNIKKKRR